jgi:hypothetical protein
MIMKPYVLAESLLVAPGGQGGVVSLLGFHIDKLNRERLCDCQRLHVAFIVRPLFISGYHLQVSVRRLARS